MKLSKRNQSRGFSIIELIAAVVIFGILAGIGIGHYQRNWTEERLKAITRETSAWLEDARLQALQQSETCVIEIDDANAALKAASHEDGNHCVEIASLDLKGKVQNIEDLVLCSEASTSSNLICDHSHTNSHTDGTTKIIITPRGTVARGGLIKLNLTQSIKNRCIIIVQPLGLIRQGIEENNSCTFNTAF